MNGMWSAIAQGAQPGGGDLFSMMMPLIIIFGVMYFLVIRPQNKKQQEHQNYLDNLKAGDRVVTQGGLLGKITRVESDVVVLDLGDRVKVRVLRAQILGPQVKDKPSTDGDNDDSKKK